MTAFRDRIFQYRLTLGELQQIQQAAELAGLRPSEWARQLAIASAVSILSHQGDNPPEGLLVNMTSTGQIRHVTSTSE